jgi:hypothetical protein
MKTKKRFVYLLILIMMFLHFDFWNWGKSYPIFFGWMPIGLFYHVVYCIAYMGVLLLLNRWCWQKPRNESWTQ